jgi:hypothetical protein
MKIHCVLCEVESEILIIISMNLGFQMVNRVIACILVIFKRLMRYGTWP